MSHRLLPGTLVLALVLAMAAPAAAQLPDLPGTDDGDEEELSPWLPRRVLNIGHRGSAFEAPENTLHSLQTAVDNGADMFEFDLFGSSDGEVVVIHDSTVDRTTDGAGAVEDMSLEELKALDAAYWFTGGSYVDHDADEDDYLYRGVATGDVEPPAGAEPNDFRIPTLEEIFERFGDFPMILEIKQLRSNPADDEVEAEICRLLDEYDRGDETIVAGFDDSFIERIAACAPEEVTTAPGTAEAASFFATSRTGEPLPGTFLRHDLLFLPIGFEGVDPIDEDTVAAAHGNDLPLHVFTVNDRETMEELIDLGVDGILSDDVTLLDEVLRERGVAFDPPGACPDGARKSPYTDWAEIPPAHVRAVDCATARGIVRGDEDGAFEPRRDVRRDQMASFIARTIDVAEGVVALPDAEDADDDFEDLEDNVHAEQIRRLFAAGIVSGRSDTTYAPAASTRRDQVASFALRAYAHASGTDLEALESDRQAFDDVGPDNVHFSAVNGAAELGLIRGRATDRFAPGSHMSRDQLATVVVGLLEALEE
jgi:glycerophosphoryl diester phosphodiesterase